VGPSRQPTHTAHAKKKKKKKKEEKKKKRRRARSAQHAVPLSAPARVHALTTPS